MLSSNTARRLGCLAAASCTLGVLGLVTASGTAGAAGVPPEVEITLFCAPSGSAQSKWIATNVDGAEHTLDVIRSFGGADLTDQHTLAAGDPSIGFQTGHFDNSLYRIRVEEDGVVLAETPLMQVDLTEPDCWKEWQPPAPEEPEGGWGPPGPPTVELDITCGSQNVEVAVVLTNVDGEAHQITVVMEHGGAEFDASFLLQAGELEGVTTFLTGAGVHRFRVSDGGDPIFDSGPLLFVVDDGEEPCSSALAPIGGGEDVPPGQPGDPSGPDEPPIPPDAAPEKPGEAPPADSTPPPAHPADSTPPPAHPANGAGAEALGALAASSGAPSPSAAAAAPSAPAPQALPRTGPVPLPPLGLLGVALVVGGVAVRRWATVESR